MVDLWGRTVSINYEKYGLCCEAMSSKLTTVSLLKQFFWLEEPHRHVLSCTSFILKRWFVSHSFAPKQQGLHSLTVLLLPEYFPIPYYCFLQSCQQVTDFSPLPLKTFSLFNISQKSKTTKMWGWCKLLKIWIKNYFSFSLSLHLAFPAFIKQNKCMQNKCIYAFVHKRTALWWTCSAF